jgi:hypothetical protein
LVTDTITAADCEAFERSAGWLRNQLDFVDWGRRAEVRELIRDFQARTALHRDPTPDALKAEHERMQLVLRAVNFHHERLEWSEADHDRFANHIHRSFKRRLGNEQAAYLRQEPKFNAWVEKQAAQQAEKDMNDLLVVQRSGVW